MDTLFPTLRQLLPSLTGGAGGGSAGDFFSFSLLDLTTALLGLAYILLEYRASVWMWAVGAVMQLLGIVLYYQKGLYADCGMEFYYLAMTAYGFWCWSRVSLKKGTATQRVGDAGLKTAGDAGQKAAATERPIRHFPSHLAAEWLAIFLVLWLGIYQLLIHLTDSTVPIADSFTTALSVVGIWALAHKYLEQWFVWIVVDVVTCWLYFQKGIPFKASLYAFYVVIAVFGYFRWRRQMRAQTVPQ